MVTTEQEPARLSPSDGSDNGVAPRSDPLTLLVEGWRFLAHSYSIVNHHQCLELLKRTDVRLLHSDLPTPPSLGNAVYDMMGEAAEVRIESISKYQPGESVDAVYRIGYPFDFSPSFVGGSFVFATCERGVVKTIDILSPPYTDGRFVRPFQERIRDNNITIITPSEWSKSGFVHSGVDPSRLKVVPHGADPEVFHPLDRDIRERERSARGQDGLFVFLNVSAMTGNKNPGGVIRAFLDVASRCPKARMVMKGMDRMYRSDMWIAQELGRLSPSERRLAKKTIYYVGTACSQRDHAMFYQLTDAYVSPYQSEGFNLPVLEAAACGVPVITTDGGPTDEFTTPDFRLPVKAKLADHEHDGSHWFQTDHQSLVEQMERVINDDEWRDRAGKAATAHVHANYSWSRIVDRLLGVIKEKVRR